MSPWNGGSFCSDWYPSGEIHHCRHYLSNHVQMEGSRWHNRSWLYMNALNRYCIWLGQKELWDPCKAELLPFYPVHTDAGQDSPCNLKRYYSFLVRKNRTRQAIGKKITNVNCETIKLSLKVSSANAGFLQWKFISYHTFCKFAFLLWLLWSSYVRGAKNCISVVLLMPKVKSSSAITSVHLSLLADNTLWKALDESFVISLPYCISCQFVALM